MSEADPSTWGEVMKAIATVAGALGLSGYLVRRNTARVDELLRDTVPRHEFNQMVQSLRDEIAAAREDQVRASTGTHARLDNILLLIAKNVKSD